MKQYILLILTTLMLVAAPAAAGTASPAILGVSDVNEAQAVRIELRGTTLIVAGGAGKTLQVFDMVGVEVLSMRIDRDEKRIDLSHLRKGIYPVKVGNVTKKIYINGR